MKYPFSILLSQFGRSALSLAAAFTLFLSLVSLPSLSMAGSDKSNPQALSKAAASVLREQQIIQKEVNDVLQRLAKDAKYARAFDAAAVKQDKAELVRLLKEGGIKTHEVSIEEIDKDLHVRIQVVCTNGLCRIVIDITW